MSPARASIRNRAGLAGLAAAALCLAACIMGGTGTDTENGLTGKDKVNANDLKGISARVTDSLGAPLRGVSLRLFDPAFRPDSGLAPADVVANNPDSLVSDTGGYVRLSLKAAGKFVVEGTEAGKTLFFDTLAVADPKQSAIYTFRARAARAFQGKVMLASGMRVDSGKVFIRGTGRTAKVAADGSYDLGLLPADAIRMALGVRFVSKPVAVRQAVPTPSADTSKRPTYTCKDVPPDSAAKLTSPATAMDPAAVRLDTGTVSPALKSCDSLIKGSVINVAPPAGSVGPTAAEASNLLVLSGPATTSTVTGMKTVEPVVVPLAQCVPTAGTENTTYAVQLQSSGAAGNLLVGDVAEKCLAK
jgi:hypothetical protein